MFFGPALLEVIGIGLPVLRNVIEVNQLPYTSISSPTPGKREF